MYRKCLGRAEKACPPPDESQRQGRRGRLKRTRARNLLERLRDYEADVLRFLDDPAIPFTNSYFFYLISVFYVYGWEPAKDFVFLVLTALLESLDESINLIVEYFRRSTTNMQ